MEGAPLPVLAPGASKWNRRGRRVCNSNQVSLPGLRSSHIPAATGPVPVEPRLESFLPTRLCPPAHDDGIRLTAKATLPIVGHECARWCAESFSVSNPGLRRWFAYGLTRLQCCLRRLVGSARTPDGARARMDVGAPMDLWSLQLS